MATLLELVAADVITKVDPMLGLREMEMRCIFLLPRALKWLSEVLPNAESDWNIQEEPSEQLDALFYEFCAGKSLQVETRFKCLTNLGEGIWQLKTADLRLFGWFAKKDHFVVCDCDLATRIKISGLYKGYCQQAVRFRDDLDLNEPKFVSGDNPDDVISDCY